MAIYGNLEEAGLPDVLQLLALGRKSGCLSVVDGEMHGEIYLSGGKVTFASVSGRAERFGEILVKNGLITRDQLQVAVDAQARGPKRPLGHILVDSGQVDRGELEQFVRLQVEEAVYFLFARRQGEFSFLSEKRSSQQALLEPLDAEGLLLEGARRVDEWSQIQRKIPSFDLVYRRTKDAHAGSVAAELTDAQRRILPLLDGTRDVAGVVDATGMGEFEVGKALYGLVMAGFAQLVDRRVSVRHLDYRDLLAWVVREAEFADPQHRKEAGRHIVDCPTCAERLRRIQVRRTEGSGVRSGFLAATAPAGPAGYGAPRAPRVSPAPLRAAPVPVRPSPVSAPAFEPPPLVAEQRRVAAAGAPPERRHAERRRQERRTGLERRQGDRRCGLDRRVAVDPAWALSHVERRRGPRRAEERRSAHGHDRRTGDREKRATEPPMASPPERRAGRGGRTTEPRLLQRPEPLDPRDWPLRVNLPVRPPEEPLAATPAAAVAEPPVVEVEALEPGEAPSSAGESVPGLSREIEWLVTPDESDQMIRASRASRRAAPGGAPAPMRAEPKAVRRAAPAPAPRIPPSAVGAPPLDEVRGGRGAPGHLTWGGADRQPREESGLRLPAIDLRGLPLRSLAVAGVIALLGVVGYGAGKFVKLTGSGGPGRAVAAGPAAPAATEAQPPAPRGGRTRAAVREERAAPEAPPAERRPATPAATVAPTRAAQPQPAAPAPRQAAAPAAQPAAPPVPTVGILRGVVRGPNGAPIPGARVSVRGTALAAVADASGAFEIQGVPDGAVTLQVSADGFVAGTADARARAGQAVNADVALARVSAPPPAAPAAAPAPAPAAAAPVAGEPDRELSEGGWNVVSRADALAALGGTLGAIGGLPIESIAKSTAGARQRVRVAQIAEGGQRVVLIETRAGAAVRGEEGPAHVTALRVLPASEAYPYATGTASFGNILITAKTGASADLLRTLLGRLAEVTQ